MCEQVQYGFDCVCEHVKTNPGTTLYGCEFCGIYTASKPRCNKCEVQEQTAEPIESGLDLNSPISSLSLRGTDIYLLIQNNILDVKTLINQSEMDLIKLPNLGRSSLKRIKEFLQHHHLQLKPSKYKC